ncbi:hypothetical protein Gotur_000027 [Gossypium turneri]
MGLQWLPPDRSSRKSKNGKKGIWKGKGSKQQTQTMADLFIGVSQSSLLHLQPKLASFQRLTGGPRFAVASNRQLHFRRLTVTGVVSSDSKAPTTVTSTVGSEKGGIDIEVDTGNGGGDKFDDRSGGGGDGGDNSGGGGDSESKGEGEFSDDGGKKMALSMSQKLTLGYAALVGGKNSSPFLLPYAFSSWFLVLIFDWIFQGNLGRNLNWIPVKGIGHHLDCCIRSYGCVLCSTVAIANSPKGSYWWLKPVIRFNPVLSRALSIRTLVLLQRKAQKCTIDSRYFFLAEGYFLFLLMCICIVGGVMGYVKSGSQKSLAAGGLSAAVLYYVYTQLPTNPFTFEMMRLEEMRVRLIFAFVERKGERVRVYWGKKEREIPSKFKFTHQSADKNKFSVWERKTGERVRGRVGIQFYWGYICCTFGSDGFPFQEVGKSLSRWGCITRITCDDRGLPAWHHAEYALVKCSGDGNTIGIERCVWTEGYFCIQVPFPLCLCDANY